MKTLDLGCLGTVRRLVHFDEADGKVHTQDVQSAGTLQAMLDRNHVLRRDGVNKTDNMVHLAEVPLVVAMAWDKEYRETRAASQSQDDFLREKLRNHDFSLLVINKQ